MRNKLTLEREAQEMALAGVLALGGYNSVNKEST